MLRRIHIQANHVSCLGFEVRIVGGQIAFKSMRFELVLGPDARHRHVRDGTAKFGGKLARGPMRRAVSRLALGGPRQHTGLNAIGHLVALAPGVAGKQPSKPIGGKALAPAIDVAVAAVKLAANLGPRQALGQQQDEPGMPSRIGSTIPRTGLPLQFHDFSFGQLHRGLHSRDSTSHLNVTVH